LPRVKRGVPARERHKKVLKATQGQRATKHLLFRRANEAYMKSLWYAHRDRRDRKRDFRRLWIVRINAAAHQCGTTYHDLICGLTKAGVRIDRKILAELAVSDSGAFAQLADVAKQAVAA
jgi:large subunit ribosomal protein L20